MKNFNDFFNNDVVWIPIYIVLSFVAHYYQKYLEKEQIKDREKLERMEKNPENYSEYEIKNLKHMIIGKTEIVIFSLSWGKYLIFLGAIYIFLNVIGVIPPPAHI